MRETPLLPGDAFVDSLPTLNDLYSTPSDTLIGSPADSRKRVPPLPLTVTGRLDALCRPALRSGPVALQHPQAIDEAASAALEPCDVRSVGAEQLGRVPLDVQGSGVAGRAIGGQA